MSTILVQEQVSAHVGEMTNLPPPLLLQSVATILYIFRFTFTWYPTLFWIKLLLDIDPNCIIFVTSEDDDDQERDRLVSG